MNITPDKLLQAVKELNEDGNSFELQTDGTHSDIVYYDQGRVNLWTSVRNKHHETVGEVVAYCKRKVAATL